MLIHAYRRTEPTVVDLLGQKIEFTPNEHQHCVADVTHAAAVQRLLAIGEAFVEYGADAEPAKSVTSPVLQPVVTLAGFSSGAEEIDIEDDRFLVASDVVQAAFERQGVTLDAWNGLPADARDELLNAEVQVIKSGMLGSVDEADEEGDAPVVAADSLVLTNGAETIDLGKYTAKQVRALAAQENVTLPAGNSTPVGELRALLAKALKGE